MSKIYGYKVCYIKIGKRRRKVYLVTNDYDFALWHVRWYERDPPKDRKTDELLHDVSWQVFPIKSFFEYRWLWRGCPFDP